MSHHKCIVVVLAIMVILTNESQGRRMPRMERDVVADGVELNLSASGEDGRSTIPVISDIQRVEKIADLLISIGEHVIPALLDGLAEQVTAAAAERKLRPAAAHHSNSDHTSGEHMLL